MKLQYIATIATASLLSTSLVGFFPSNASASPVRGSSIIVAQQKNPCAANPCAANPCAANPCAANPCAANPCAAN